MRKILLTTAAISVLAVAGSAQRHDRNALRLANRIAAAFSNGLSQLDRRPLVRGRLHVTRQYDIFDVGQKEFEYKVFRSFTAMERWMKSEQQADGTPFRYSGERVSCRHGLCRLDLVDGQMAHNHVFLTRIWYGYRNRRIFVKKLRLLYG